MGRIFWESISSRRYIRGVSFQAFWLLARGVSPETLALGDVNGEHGHGGFALWFAIADAVRGRGRQAPRLGGRMGHRSRHAGAQLGAELTLTFAEEHVAVIKNPVDVLDLHQTEAAFTFSAVEHHVGAGRCQGFEDRGVGADLCLDVEPGNSDQELFGLEPTAVAERLITQVVDR